MHNSSTYPHQRTLRLTRDMAAALAQIARWRQCRQSDVVRAACEVTFRREYDLRGVSYPDGATGTLPGQLDLPLGYEHE